jgi:hypothetical protein
MMGEARRKALEMLARQRPITTKIIEVVDMLAKISVNTILIVGLPLYAGFIVWYLIVKDVIKDPKKMKRYFTQKWFWSDDV